MSPIRSARRNATRSRGLALGVVALALLASACSSSTGTGGPDGGPGTGPDGTTTNGSWDGNGPIQVSDAGRMITENGVSRVCYPTTCANHMLECGDCQDNDGDGLFDSRDPECLGPCDNTERADLLTGVGGETAEMCRADCYFDFGNGSGNDQCYWDHRCDPVSVAPNFPPEGPRCALDTGRIGSRDCPATQNQNCLNYCMPLTPNGCDCFGCCTFPQLAGRGPNGGPGYVWLGSRNADGQGSCTFAQINDPNACKVCTPVVGCLNECGPCEVCLGRPTPPPECNRPPPPPDSGTPPPPSQCAAGLQPCGVAGQAECAAGSYCITGCCQVAPP